MSRRSRAGVTFMEIVYALVIIAVVAAVLFPVFQKPVTNNRRASCQSDLKQLGLAIIQYEQDADGGFPTGFKVVGNGWAGQLYPYTKSTGVYHCPNDPHEGSYVSYAENQNLVKRSVNDLATPAATVELYEFTTLNCDPATVETVSATRLSAPQDSKRHDGDTPQTTYGLNFLTVDGHVKYLTPEKVSGGPGAVRAKALPQGTYMETFAIK